MSIYDIPESLLNASKEAISEVKKSLSEAKGDAVVDKLVADVADATDRNDHTGSLVLIAKWLKDRRMIKRLEAIETITMLDGSLDTHIGQYRLSLMKKLLKLAQSRLSKEQFEALNGAL